MYIYAECISFQAYISFLQQQQQQQQQQSLKQQSLKEGFVFMETQTVLFQESGLKECLW